MKNAIFITVRTDSSRLPNKALLKILEKPIIELVILRAKQVKNSDNIILCTTIRQIDDELVQIAKKCGIEYFRGSVEDKLERWLGASKRFNVDYFITVDGDDLFCDPELIEISIQQMESGKCDFIKAPRGLICGAFTYCIKTSALEKVCNMKDTNDTEMMWVYFENTGIFNVCNLNVRDKIFFSEEIRLTLDYEEDFQFFATVFETLACKNNDLPLRRIAKFLNDHPEIVAINSFRQKDYLENQRRKTKLIIKESIKQ
jgi:spore coat polysaccharide biosynthesis protein SpsF